MVEQSEEKKSEGEQQENLLNTDAGKQRYCFVIRHGERSDRWGSKEKTINKVDPGLTQLGRKQAKETGEFLRTFIGENLPKNTFVEVKIEASPFLRCIATAGEIAQILQQTKIEVNYLFSEHQDQWLYKENPMPQLELKLKTPYERLAEEYDLP